MKFLTTFFFIFQCLPLFAQTASEIEYRECKIYFEDRVSYSGNTICIQEMNCIANNVTNGRFAGVTKRGICPLSRSTHRCPVNGAECLDDKRLSPNDIRIILSIMENSRTRRPFESERNDCIENSAFDLKKQNSGSMQ